MTLKRAFGSLALALACCGCGPAYAANYVLDLGWKDIAFTNSMALGENADVEIRNNGGAVSEGVFLYLTDREKNVLAYCTNMVDGSVSNSSAGTLVLATSNLLAKFEDASPRAEKTFDLSVWDSAENHLLASAPVVIRNNPVAEEMLAGWTSVTVQVQAELEESIAAAYALAQSAYDMAGSAANGDVAYGTDTNLVYRGDWGAAVSNRADAAYSLASTGAVDAVGRANLATASNSLRSSVLGAWATASNALPLSGGTMSGGIDLNINSLSNVFRIFAEKDISNPAIDMQDAGFYGNWKFNGGINVGGETRTNWPQTNALASTNFVTNAVAGYLPLAGGSMDSVATIDMNQGVLTNVSEIGGLSSRVSVNLEKSQMYGNWAFESNLTVNKTLSAGIVSASNYVSGMTVYAGYGTNDISLSHSDVKWANVWKMALDEPALMGDWIIRPAAVGESAGLTIYGPLYLSTTNYDTPFEVTTGGIVNASGFFSGTSAVPIRMSMNSNVFFADENETIDIGTIVTNETDPVFAAASNRVVYTNTPRYLASLTNEPLWQSSSNSVVYTNGSFTNLAIIWTAAVRRLTASGTNMYPDANGSIDLGSFELTNSVDPVARSYATLAYNAATNANTNAIKALATSQVALAQATYASNWVGTAAVVAAWASNNFTNVWYKGDTVTNAVDENAYNYAYLAYEASTNANTNATIALGTAQSVLNVSDWASNAAAWSSNNFTNVVNVSDTNGWEVGSHAAFLTAESDPVYATGAVTRAGFSVSGNTTSAWDAASQTLSIYGDGGGGGEGSGFPLEANGDLAGHSLTNGFFAGDGSGLTNLAGSVTNIGFGLTGNGGSTALAVDATKIVTNNQGSVSFGRINATTTTISYVEATTGKINHDFTVYGNLNVVSNFTVNATYTTNLSTNVLIGVSTTYVADVYTTNFVYTYEFIGTQQVTTNLVQTYVQSGGSFGMGAGSTFDATNATAVRFPFFSSTATGGVAAIGNWDVSGATFTGLVAKETDPIFTNWLAAQGANFPAPLAAIADGTATLNVTSRTWRVVQGGDTLTNWAFTGANTSAVVSFVVSLERGAGTFAWPSGNTNAAAANSTNVFFIYRPAGREPWIVE